MLASELTPRYELLGELAVGGMATVYLGRQQTPDGRTRLVAIKSIKPELAQDEGFLAMFLDEAALTSRIKHRNVVPTLDLVSSDGRLLIVMVYVEGVSLGKLLESAWQRRTSIPAAVAIAILRDVLYGLHAAHELVDETGRPLAVVHRDVSPQNVLVGVDGVARILDFGIAKAASQQHVTAHGEIKGKLAYMPIEQQLGEAVDRRSDVYAAGVVFWELLTGRRLFSEPNEEKLVRQVFEGRVDPPSLWADEPLPPAIDHVVLRAVARKREERWSTAEEMANAATQAMPPASHAEVAAVVRELGRADLEQRARHVRDLESAHTKLAPEEQLVLELLTGDRRRSARLTSTTGRPQELGRPRTRRDDAAAAVVHTHAPRMSAPPPAPFPPPPAPVPLGPVPLGPVPLGPVAVSPSVPPPVSRDADRRARRERRRRRRRLLFVGIAVAIVISTIVAFLLGMGIPNRPG